MYTVVFVGEELVGDDDGIGGVGRENWGEDVVNKLCETDEVSTVVGRETTPVEPDCGGAVGEEDVGAELDGLATLDSIDETIVVGTDTLDDGAVLLEGDE